MVTRYAAKNNSSVNSLIQKYLIEIANRESTVQKALLEIRELSFQTGSRIGSQSWKRDGLLWALILLLTLMFWSTLRLEMRLTRPSVIGPWSLLTLRILHFPLRLFRSYMSLLHEELEVRLTPEQALQWIEQLEEFPCVPSERMMPAFAPNRSL